MIPSRYGRTAPAKGGREAFPAGAARHVVYCLLGLVLCGCYRYVPVDLASVQRAEFVRVEVTEQAAVRLVKDFGAYLTSLEGQFSREGTDSVSVTVPVSRDYRGVSLEGGRQTLFLGLQEVKGLRRREFSRSRTMAVSVGSLVVFAAIVASVAQWGDPNSEVVEPPPPPPPSGAIIFRFRIP
jgi:hypothetical protein